MPERVFVTDHALERWRERFAADAATAPEVADALRESRVVADGEPLPLARKPDTAYYFHPPTGAYFVVEGLSADSARVLTVIDPAPPANPLLPKSAAKRKADLEGAEETSAAAPTPAADPAAAYLAKRKEREAADAAKFYAALRERAWEAEPPRPGESPEDEFARLRTRKSEIVRAVTGMTRLDGGRAPLVREMLRIDARLQELRPAVMAARLTASETELRRPDGGYNYGPCIAHLMRRDEERDAETAALRERVARLESWIHAATRVED